jgi:AcrR family transcriptional regulator
MPGMENGGRGASTRARLIEATTDVVRRVGYARATTRAIADAADVAEGTIYRHFPDKQHLFFAAVVERNAPVIEWVSALPERAGSATVRENLLATLRRLEALSEDVLPLELSLRADPDLAREHRKTLAALPGGPPPGPPQHIAAYLEAEQGLGRVRADADPARAALVIIATLFGLAVMPVADPSRTGEDLLDGALDVILLGLSPTPS